MAHRPSLPATSTEQALDIIGKGTLAVALMAGALTISYCLYLDRQAGGNTPLFWLAWLAGLVVGALVSVGAVWAFAAAEALGYLRRAEERTLIAEWEANQSALVHVPPRQFK